METRSHIPCPVPTEEVCEHGGKSVSPRIWFLDLTEGTSVMVSQCYFQLAESTALIP